MRSVSLMVVCLVTGIMTQVANAVVPVGPQINIYGGASNLIGKASALTLNSSSFTETDTLLKNKNPWDFTAGIGVDYDFLAGSNPNNYIHDFSIGLDFFWLNMLQQGDVLQFGSPQLNNFAYKLQLNTTRLMLDGQLNFQPIAGKVIPFVNAGIGAAKISTSYHDTPLPSSGISGGISLPAKTTHNVAYAIGAGLKLPLTQKVQVSVSYLYTFFGTNGTDSAPTPLGDGTIQPVTIGLGTQAVLAGLTYTIG